VKAGIQFDELLAYTEEENQRWQQFFARHPEALDLPLDIAGNVRELVRHIFAVELFFANQVTAEKKSILTNCHPQLSMRFSGSARKPPESIAIFSPGQQRRTGRRPSN
jgi:hypothetical protein